MNHGECLQARPVGGRERAKVRKDTPGAKWVESRFWMVKIYIDGKPKLVKGYTDKQASEQLGAKLQRDKAQGAQGLVDPYKAHCARPLVEHVGDWIAELRQLGAMRSTSPRARRG